MPQELASGFPVCSRHSLHAITWKVQRSAETFCLHAFIVHPLPLFIPKWFFPSPQIEAPHLWARSLASTPLPSQALAASSPHCSILSVSDVLRWHWGARLAVSVGSTHAV